MLAKNLNNFIGAPYRISKFMQFELGAYKFLISGTLKDLWWLELLKDLGNLAIRAAI